MPPRLVSAALLVVALVLGAAPARGAPTVRTPVALQDAGPGQDAPDEDPVERTRAVVREQAVEARERLGALRVAQASLASTGAAFATRLEAMAAAADEAALDQLGQRAMALQVQLDDLLSRSERVVGEVERLGERVDALEAELMERLDAAVVPRLQDLLDMDVAASGLVAEAASLGSSSDALVGEMARFGAGVEDVRRTLDVAVGAMPVAEQEQDEGPAVDLSTVPVAEVVTDQGSLLLSFRPDVAPNHVENFFDLARDGFYDGLTFHRVIPGFVAQGGCPVGDGSGGPGHRVAAEFNALPHRRGALSMARFGHPDSAGSQFFIVLDDWSGELDRKYTVFGHLLRGYETLDRIAARGTDGGETLERIGIRSVTIRPRTPDDVPEDPTERRDG